MLVNNSKDAESSMGKSGGELGAGKSYADYPSYLNSSGGNSSMESDDGGEDEENLVRGSSCGATVGASIVKRWNIYRRDYVGFIC